MIPAGISPGSGGETWFAALTSSQQATWISTMVADHVQWLRIDVYPTSLTTNSTLAQDAENAGINVDAIIEVDGISPLNPTTYATACTNAATTYQAIGVNTFEMINEPNASSGAPFPLAPATYESYIAACYPALKAVDPSATVLLGGLAVGQSTEADLPAPYLQSIYTAQGGGGTKDYFDAVNMHPYDYDYPLDQTPETTDECSTDPWNPWTNCPTNDTNGQQNEIQAVRTVMNSNGDNGKAIWLTEFGCPTGTDAGQPDSCTDATLATQITDAYTQARANPGNEYGLLGPLFICSWIDNTTDGDFGLYTSSGTAKPDSLAAFIGSQLVTVQGVVGLF